VDCKELTKFAKTLENVEVSEVSPFLCTEAGQGEIMKDIEEKNLNRIIASA
jgi:heterodisulfide reductase subunit A-like polyferredoxin